ncbi:MAG: ABC transporter ATP-binding protein [Lachnospiraceae bacterium]|nr:ABC transporter ATP-binding protein [Lachnospiraceae bacterium]
MIEVKNITKSFEDIKALDSVTADIQEGQVFGLIGTNGAGKSTFLRILCGVLKPEEGSVIIDGEYIYENEKLKQNMFYISDEQHFFRGETPNNMRDFYASVYEKYDKAKFDDLIKKFGLDPTRKISTFSKGMKKQLSVILGICAGVKYLLCDETFDGLDPVMRQAVKSLFAAEMQDNGMTPIIASHNLRELEDICDHVGLLHKGGILFSKDLDDLKCNIHKIQCVFSNDEAAKEFIDKMKPVQCDTRGSLYTMTLNGTEEDIENELSKSDTVFSEILPLSLEEIFISETEIKGYDIRNLIL